MTQLLFVHGMGRSRRSAWPVLRRLRQKGLTTKTFGYMASIERFDAICERLATTITAMTRDEPVLLIGHSLGGVLIRAALARLDRGTQNPAKAPQRVFLLASPQTASRMARSLQHNFLFRALTGECGQLLANPVAMARIPAITSPVTSIVGIRAIPFNRAFGLETNDGVVALSEVRAPWLIDEVQLDLIHSVLPVSRQVADVVLERLEQDRASSRQ